jgi:5-formyltetrahydrofolate cyclo-ligase
MAFRPWRPGDELVTNRFGIGEPPADRRDDRPATDLDVVVVPCVALDRNGNRLGFGAGFYDRALAAADAQPLTVAVAFGRQVVAELPRREWDVPVGVVLTEDEVIRPGG